MFTFYDLSAPKKPTNLSVNSDLLKQTKALKINLSATLEQALKDILIKRKEFQWKNENINSIQAYNDFIEDNGCFGDDYRSF